MTLVTNNNKAKMDSTYKELVVANLEILAQIRAHLGSNDIGFEEFASYAMGAAQGFTLLTAGRELLEGDNDDLRRIRNNALLSKREAYMRFMELQYKIDAGETDDKVSQKIDAGQVEALARFYYYNNRAESAKAVLAERNVKTIEVPAELLEQIKALPAEERQDVVTSEIFNMISEPGEIQTTVAEAVGKRKRKTK